MSTSTAPDYHRTSSLRRCNCHRCSTASGSWGRHRGWWLRLEWIHSWCRQRRSARSGTAQVTYSWTETKVNDELTDRDNLAMHYNYILSLACCRIYFHIVKNRQCWAAWPACLKDRKIIQCICIPTVRAAQCSNGDLDHEAIVDSSAYRINNINNK